MAFLSFSFYLLLPVDALMDLRTLLMQIKPSIEGLQKFFARKEENYTSKLLPLSACPSFCTNVVY